MLLTLLCVVSGWHVWGEKFQTIMCVRNTCVAFAMSFGGRFVPIGVVEHPRRPI